MNRRRAELLAGVRARTGGPLAPLRRRRLLAYGYLAAVGLAAVSALGRSTLATVGELVGLIGIVVLLLALRRATSLVADAPDEALDELMLRLRDRCYVGAYQFLGGMVALACLVLWIGGELGLGLPAPASGGGLGAGVTAALAWCLFGLALGLPAVVTAVTLPDVDRADRR